MYSYDNNFFDKIDSEKKAYLLGYIYADGYVSTKVPWFLVVQSIDLELINIVKDTLSYNGPIRKTKKGGFENSKEGWRLAICRKELCIRLNELQAKSHRVFESIPTNLKRHFIRGLFDGDGSITLSSGYYKESVYQKPIFSIILDKEMMSIIHPFFKELGYPTTISQSKTEWMSYLKISGKKNCILLKDYLYRDATVFLSRKKNIFDQISAPAWEQTGKTSNMLETP